MLEYFGVYQERIHNRLKDHYESFEKTNFVYKSIGSGAKKFCLVGY